MCAASAVPAAMSGDKLALVIGNNKYQARNCLENPKNDAFDMAIALSDIHFDVRKGLDAAYDDMAYLISSFVRKIRVNDVVLFYFAGHAHQWEDQNYLIPSDDDYIEGENMKHHAFNVQDILNRITEKKPFVTILILDCCRKYHLRHYDLKDVGRGPQCIDQPKGLRKIYNSSSATNSLIAYACAAGHIAADISAHGRNGLFTWHLLQHMRRPNQDIAMVLRDVARDVYNETKNNEHPQIPWINCSLQDQDIFLYNSPDLGFDPHLSENCRDVNEKDSKAPNNNLISELKLGNATAVNDAVEVASLGTATIAVTEKDQNYVSRYAEEYQTIRALGKGAFGYVFEAVNKLDGRRLAVKRVSFKNKHQQKKATKEVRALVVLDHPNVIRYIYAWLETPPLGWQNKEDTTYDFRDISRASTRTNTSTAGTDNTTATAISLQEDSDEEPYNCDYFLKILPPPARPVQNDSTENEIIAHTSGDSAEMIGNNVDGIASPFASRDETPSVRAQRDADKIQTKTSYFYYSMELCDGDTLEKRLGPYVLTKEQACDILRQITEAIAYIHEKKLIHGDIKPANIFFSAGNSIKIGDFGLAAEIVDSDDGAVIDRRKAHGTRWYMAPELRKKRQDIQYDQKVDIYAMGIVFLEILAPFENGHIRSAVFEEIRKYAKRNLDITPLLTSYTKAVDLKLLYEPIVLSLLNPLPSERPSAKDLLNDKFFRRLINGIHVDKFLPSARPVREIPFGTPNIEHGCFDCSEDFILLYENENYTFILYNVTGQILGKLLWTRDQYDKFGYVGKIRWSVFLRTFLVLSHRALFELKQENSGMILTRIGAIFAPNKLKESKLRFITFGTKHGHLFLNRGYHTIQQYKMRGWTEHRKWMKNSLNYTDIDEIRSITVDRDGEYMVMDVRENGNTWFIDVRTIDDNLTPVKRLRGFHHKLQLFCPSHHWLILHDDPNKLYLYDITGDDTQIPKEVAFGDDENDPQFSFSQNAHIHFRWMGNTHLLLGTPVDSNQTGLLKLYSV